MDKEKAVLDSLLMNICAKRVDEIPSDINSAS